MLTTPQSIAKYFRDSVSFDFNKKRISSIQDIEAADDDFYTLMDKEAFFALLNDALGYDNQLVDIFGDIFNLRLGIHSFANEWARAHPRMQVECLLKKYPYHQSDIAKVYLAFNTWLVFFGCDTLSPEWTRCPFCGDVVKAGAPGSFSGVCANVRCKKTTAEFASASSELAIMLAEETAGKSMPDPKFWDSIKKNTEFYIAFRLPIERLRLLRNTEETAKFEKNKKEVLETAVKELNKIRVFLDVETGKRDPDFSSILDKLTQNQQINEACKYNDSTFIKKVSELTKLISQRSEEFLRARDEIQKTMALTLTVKRFFELQSLLEKELKSTSISLEPLCQLLADMDEVHNRILVENKLSHRFNGQEILREINKYETSLRPQIVERISKKERDALMARKQSELIARVNDFLSRVSGIQAKDDKSKQMLKAFSAEIEENEYFDDYRVECGGEYLEITSPIRSVLSELVKLENEIKLEDFKNQAEEIIAELDKAQPSEYSSKSFQKCLNSIKAVKRYASIHGSAEYTEYTKKISQKIGDLQSREKAYSDEVMAALEAKERRNSRYKIAGIIFVATAVLGSIISLSFYSWTIGQWIIGSIAATVLIALTAIIATEYVIAIWIAGIISAINVLLSFFFPSAYSTMAVPIAVGAAVSLFICACNAYDDLEEEAGMAAIVMMACDLWMATLVRGGFGSFSRLFWICLLPPILLSLLITGIYNYLPLFGGVFISMFVAVVVLGAHVIIAIVWPHFLHVEHEYPETLDKAYESKQTICYCGEEIEVGQTASDFVHSVTCERLES